MKLSEVRLFYLISFLSLVIAALGYSIQFILFDSYFQSQTVLFNLTFRLIRMVVGYVILPIIFFRIAHEYFSKYGFEIRSSKNFLISFVLGILLYLVPSYIFVKYEIFTAQWKYRSWSDTIIFLIIIGLMASITDYWTRGFVLLKLEGYYGRLVAIIGQNLVWFVLHIYEINLLIPFIGIVPSILLTLFLGIVGDLIILHFRNITGLMLGHVVLNVFIALAGKGVL